MLKSTIIKECFPPVVFVRFVIKVCVFSPRVFSQIIEKIINLKQLSKNSLKRNDKKSGRKKPRPNDYDKDIIPAPDSAAATENEVSEEPIKVKKN